MLEKNKQIITKAEFNNRFDEAEAFLTVDKLDLNVRINQNGKLEFNIKRLDGCEYKGNDSLV